MEIAASMPSQDAGAFEALLQAHRGIMLKVAATYARDHDERADLAQEIAAQLWRAWPRYDPRQPFSTWMYRIALNVGISHLRGAGRRDRVLMPLDEAVHEATDPSADAHEAGQQVRMLLAVIATFEPLDRALLLLYLEQRSTREMAEVLGIGESNVTTKLSRLKRRIRDHFETTGAKTCRT